MGRPERWPMAHGPCRALRPAHRPTSQTSADESARPRRAVGAVVYDKNTGRRQPMTMRVLAPLPGTADSTEPSLVSLKLMNSDAEAMVPSGCQALRLVPPRWSETGKVFQLAFEGRAARMSNKNVQLESSHFPGARPARMRPARPEGGALQEVVTCRVHVVASCAQAAPCYK